MLNTVRSDSRMKTEPPARPGRRTRALPALRCEARRSVRRRVAERPHAAGLVVTLWAHGVKRVHGNVGGPYASERETALV